MRTTTQAPEVNLVATKTMVAVAVSSAPVPLRAARSSQRGECWGVPVVDQPSLANGEAGEHPDRVQRDEPGGVGGDRDQQDAREHG